MIYILDSFRGDVSLFNFLFGRVYFGLGFGSRNFCSRNFSGRDILLLGGMFGVFGCSGGSDEPPPIVFATYDLGEILDKVSVIASSRSDDTSSLIVDLSDNRVPSGSLKDIVGSGGVFEGDIFVMVDNITGGSGDDEFTGDDKFNRLEGLGGDDTLEGRGGDDTLDGGLGIDTASYSKSADPVTVTLSDSGGAAFVMGGDADGDIFISIEDLRGSGYADVLTGNSGVNKIEGGGGNDLLDGGDGGDDLRGGDGTDTVSYAESDSAVTVMLQDDGSASGMAEISGGYAAGDDLMDIESLIGSGHDDIFVGNSGANTIEGGVGDDMISGGGASDTLNGGDGSDTINGDSGNDMISGDAGNDIIFGGLGDDIITGGSGNDELTGGVGRDIFITSVGNGVDTIFDFSGVGPESDILSFASIESIMDMDDLTPSIRTDGKFQLSFDSGSDSSTSDAIIFDNIDSSTVADDAELYYQSFSAHITFTLSEMI